MASETIHIGTMSFGPTIKPASFNRSFFTCLLCENFIDMRSIRAENEMHAVFRGRNEKEMMEK